MSSGHAKNRILSTWTPLNNDEANRKVCNLKVLNLKLFIKILNYFFNFSF